MAKSVTKLEHHIAAFAVVDVDGLRPEISKRSANGKGKDERNYALKDKYDADTVDDAPVERKFKDLVVEEEGGQFGKHDGGRISEFENFG
ncbi:hypothetical protein K4F52_001571 [Lecanicillium sp. MT-2017a]|nr:hypothetical protein K4F52_001571 [Lecanicillium sp. MT-2017a]